MRRRGRGRAVRTARRRDAAAGGRQGPADHHCRHPCALRGAAGQRPAAAIGAGTDGDARIVAGARRRAADTAHRSDGRARHRHRAPQHQSQLVRCRSRPRDESHLGPERGHGGLLRGACRSLCGVRVRRAPVSRSCGAAARRGHQEAGTARCRNRRQRRRGRARRCEVSPVLGKGRGAWGRRVHPSAGDRFGRAEQSTQGQRPAGQCDRQPARDHDRALAFDLRRHARSIPRPEDLRGARRGLSARRT